MPFPDLWDSVVIRSTFSALPSAALLNLHQSLLSLNFRITLKLWFPSSIFLICLLVLICNLTGSLSSSLCPLWQYLQCWVNLHFCPTPSALKTKPKPEQNPLLQDLLQDALASLWFSIVWVILSGTTVWIHPSYLPGDLGQLIKDSLAIPSLPFLLVPLTTLLFPAHPCCLHLLALFQTVYFSHLSITDFPDLYCSDLTVPFPEPFSCLSSYSLCSPGSIWHNSVAQENNYFSWPWYLSSFRPISLLCLFTLLQCVFPVIP